MARSAEKDPLEKFRFRVSVISIDLSVSNVLETAANAGFINASVNGKSLLKILNRAGFSEVGIPQAKINSFTYRENIDAFRSQKNAGLVTYEPITMRRGVTENRDFYDWFRIVNDEMALLAVSGELARESKFVPTQNDRFRRDIAIEVLDRKGEPKKGWYVMNAFPIAYKGGDDLNASSEEKLVEELTFDYEMFLEFEGGIEGFAKELAKGALIGGVGAGIGALKDKLLPI